MDPLKIEDPNDNKSNKRGRPRKEDIVYFTPQPKSLIISQLINKTDTEEMTGNKYEEPREIKELKVEYVTDHQHNEQIINEHELIKSTKSRRKILTQKPLQYFCDYTGCSYSCKLACNLIKHKRIHTSEKPYLCEQCTFRTNFVNSLKVHKRTHTANRPYACKVCSYRCNSSSNLKKHCLHRHPEVPKT